MSVNVKFLEKNQLWVPPGPLQIIGVAGRKGVGKDSFCSELGPMGYGEVRFADALKNLLNRYMGEQLAYIDRGTYSRPVPGTSMDVRMWLESVGTVLCKEIDPMFWVRCAVGTIRTTFYDKPAFVADVRKPIEAKAIQAMGGVVVRVLRPEIDRAEDKMPSTADIDQIDHDYILVNNKSLEDFFQASKDLIVQIEKEKGWRK